MENFIIPAILLAGLFVAYKVTMWINWYTFGENQERQRQLKERLAARQATRKEDTAEDRTEEKDGK